MIPSDFHDKVNSAFGWLWPEEAELLYRHAKQSISGIVEIGSFEGKSTIALALGTMDGTCAQIYAIDPHKGSPDIHKIFGPNVDTYNKFTANIRRLKLLPVVQTIRDASENVVKTFDKRFDLVFIDGRHEYEFVKLDTQWLHKLQPRGYAIFHDCIDTFEGDEEKGGLEWGVNKAVTEFLKQNSNFSMTNTVRSCAILQKGD